MDSQSISIIVLTYNRKRLLKDCLDSLLRQTSWSDGVEVLVADDGSEDGTDRLVVEYGAAHLNIKHLYHKHQGIAATRNMGIRAARGEIIAIVADDYVLPPNYLQIIQDFFREQPSALVVRFKIVSLRNDLGSRISHYYYDVSTRRRLYNHSLEKPNGWPRAIRMTFQKMPAQNEQVTTQHDLEASGAAAFRRNVFDRVGFFDESLARAEDSDLTLRLRAQGIDIYYYPHLHIQHQYHRLMLDTIGKSFQTGRSRYHYFRKHSIRPRLLGGSRLEGLFVLVNALRHVETAQFVIYAPFIMVFEAANKLGFLCSRIFSARGIEKSEAALANGEYYDNGGGSTHATLVGAAQGSECDDRQYSVIEAPGRAPGRQNNRNRGRVLAARR